jgi:hypothetical protein
VLGAPRSFTSVVGSMLGQHPQMYGLPETQLLLCETLAEWTRRAAQASYAMDHGLLRAVAELHFGGQTEATVRRASGWLRRRLHLSTGVVMEDLAERVRPLIPVDKSAALVWRLDALRRTYAMFPCARFVHLVRHPRGHGESVLKLLAYRAGQGPVPPSHWLMRLSSYGPPAADGEPRPPAADGAAPDPQWGWYALNRNIVKFLAEVPPAQVYRVRGEDLLTDPDAELPRLARWLGLRDDAAAVEEMKHPERSPYARFGPPGARYGNDMFFLKDPVLRPQRARPTSLEGPLPWRRDGGGLAPEVCRLARELGYA